LSVETAANRGLAPASSTASPESATFFDHLKTLGFRLQHDPGPSDDQAKPAEFSFVHTFEKPSGTTYDAEFFLAWDAHRALAADPTLELSAQGKLKTGSTATDAWIFRADAAFWNHTDFVDGLYTTIGLKDESTLDYKYNRLSAEIVTTPTVFQWAMGQ